MPVIYTLIALCAAAGAILLLSYVCYRMAFARNKKDAENAFLQLDGPALAQFKDHTLSMMSELDAYECEQVSIKSRDGLTLRGRYYPLPGSKMTEIQFHGYRGTARRDFAGGGIEALHKGNNLLLIDQRAHGESEGGTITFGIMERYDCLEWIKFANERIPDGEIFLFGISMGAATVLMASELDLPDNLRCIVADCPYSSPEQIIRRVIREMHLPTCIAFPLLRLGGRIFGGFDICSASPVEAVRRTRVPILLVHGEADSFVPCDMSREIYEACASPLKKRITFPQADHGVSFLTDRDRYMREVIEFTSLAEKTVINGDK